MTRRWLAWPVGLWALLLALGLGVIAQTRFVADLSAFMPRLPTQRQQLLLDQLQDGIVARLIMVGIEGGEASSRARLSRALGQRLRQDPAFQGVQNGDAELQERDHSFFFEHRYLLSPAVTPERFTVEGLRQAIGESLQGLAGNGGLLLKRLLPRDPTGETLALLAQFNGESQPASLEGAWASRDGQRAILLLQTRAAGSDIDAQAAAQQRIRTLFAQLPDRPADARLVMSGTGVFSVASRATIESEVSRLATVSLVLVVALLLTVYRSPRLLLLGLLPVLSGAVAGVAAVSLGFGQVHGLTLGFGTTLIGEAVDYSIYLFVQRADRQAPAHFWRTIRLGVLTSIVGFAAMLLSGFPGLAQLGLYSIAGLLAAVLVTRFVLPPLMPEVLPLRDLAPVGQILLGALRRLPRLQAGVLVLMGLAVGLLAWHHDHIWNRQLSALSPVSQADQTLDASLRADLGAPDLRYMASISAPDEETALRRAEQTAQVLRQLQDAQWLGGFSSPALALPSQATQQARLAALPPADLLRSRLAEALQGAPLKAERLQGFVDDVSRSRQAPLIRRADLQDSSAGMLVDSLLVHRAHDVLALLPLHAAPGQADGELDLAHITQALAAAHVPDITVIDLLAETTGIFDHYLHEALRMSGLGMLAVLLLLALHLRDGRRVLRVALPLACAVLTVAGGLVWSGHPLTILHLVGLLLVVAVGSNYALFFDSGLGQGSLEEQGRTLVSIAVANLTTVCSFATLGLSKVPLLAAMGSTVAPGALLALLFSAILCSPRGAPHAR